VPLFEGTEHEKYAKLRADAFESIWAAKQGKLEDVLTDANAETVTRIASFIDETSPKEWQGQIATGLVTSGLATSSSGSMFEPIARRAKESEGCSIICVPAAGCPNLKTALKTIIRNGTDSSGYDTDDEEDMPAKKKSRLLNFDLQALQEHQEDKGISKCVLFFQSSEALDGNVLGDLIDVLISWQDRIPFIILFEIAVPVDLFQEKLSRSTVRQLRGTTFESKTASEILDLMFLAATSPDDSNPVYLGAGTSRLLLDRQEEHIQSAKGFISALKYMYMVHFFNNPLTVLLSPSLPTDLQPKHRAAIRRLKSFIHHMEDLSTEDPEEARRLQDSETYLTEQIPQLLATARTRLLALLDALRVLHAIHAYTSAKNPLTWSTLYTKSMAGQLAESPLFRELLLVLRKLPSDSMQALLSALSSIDSVQLGTVRKDLDRLLARAQTTGSKDKTANLQPIVLRSAHDPSHSTTRTTVLSQKISLTQTQSALSPLDTEYSRLSTRVHSLIRNYFTATLLAPVEIPLSEILIFDTKTAVTNVLGAAPRAAMERAMARPGDYLACDCCSGDHAVGIGEDGGLTGKEPATSVVWQLIQEAGAIINVQDLWKAFEAIVAGDQVGEEVGEDGKAKASMTL
jgi:origin recognition complex subunit 3